MVRLIQERGWRLLLALFSIFSLSVFFHFREVRLEVLEPNTTANRYIVAQVDFQCPDYESTIFLKQRAMREVGSIEQIDPKQIQQIKALLSAKKWDDEETLECILSEFTQARFTDPHTLHIAQELDLPYRFYSTEKPLEALITHLSERFTAPLLLLFQEMEWKLRRDAQLERHIRSEVSKTIPEKYVHVQAGERLIEPGEKVTSRHLTMMQAMKQELSDSRKLWEPLPMLGSVVLSLIFVLISALYFFYYQPQFARSVQHLSLFICILFITILFAKGAECLLLRSTNSFFEQIKDPVIAPFATLLLCVLISPRIALFAAVFLPIIFSVSLAVVDHTRFILLNLVPSLVVIICTRTLRKRKEVFSIFAKAALSTIPLFYVFILSENQFWNSSLLIDLASAFLFLTISAILSVGLLPVFESLFRVLTDMTLMEYTDSSNPLLQKLALEVPGTYQHSLVVAHLAETCAVEIGANGLFCRTSALYHDIGKMMNPQFYTENQQASLNVHQLLTPVESAQVIISHVIDGEQLARKYRLPQAFIDIIRQHHGTTLVYYFYHAQLQQNKEKEIEIEQFRYPGPKPQTKEAAILMICDSVEAASRSLDEVTEQSLAELIEHLVQEKASERQFEECNLTFEELTRIKRKLIKALCATQHSRVKYPKKIWTNVN
jgi:cyclic-di-AMP phosphodiesterase PgpH